MLMTRIKFSHLWPGVPLALASALSFGASTPLSKILLVSVNPQLLAGLLYLGAGIGLVAFSSPARPLAFLLRKHGCAKAICLGSALLSYLAASLDHFCSCSTFFVHRRHQERCC